MSGCDRELNAHFYSAASLKYHVPDTWHHTTPSHIILTLGRPVLALPRKSECQAKRPGIEPVTSHSPERTLYQLSYRGRSIALKHRYNYIAGLVSEFQKNSNQYEHNVRKHGPVLSVFHAWYDFEASRKSHAIIRNTIFFAPKIPSCVLHINAEIKRFYFGVSFQFL